MRTLPQLENFFHGPTIEVARQLIGATLRRIVPKGQPDSGETLAGRIVETEAYLPIVDPACHAYRGPTKRNAVMFGRPGHAYVYFVYGNHFCLNVTTERPGIGGAVLIRALEPLEGIEAMRRRRTNVADEAIASGPGNLCRAMAIDGACNGVDLRGGNLSIEPPAPNARSDVVASARIGIVTAVDWPLRFYDRSSPSVSPYRKRRLI